MLGKQWLQVPVRHDILRSDYWIYNRSFSGKQVLLGKTCNFYLHLELPSKEDEGTVEWKTIDLLNNIETYSCCYSFQDAVRDVTRAIIEKKLNYDLLTKMVRKFGEDLAKSILGSVLIRGDLVDYGGKLYYYQPNGSSCYLYANEEDIGDASKKVCSPAKKFVKKCVSWDTLKISSESIRENQTTLKLELSC